MDFPGNSHKETEKSTPTTKPAKAEKEKVEKVVVGEVVQRKRSIGSRFKSVFVGGEFKGASQYIVSDVLLPAMRNMVVDATTKGIERVIYGESSASRRRPSDPYRPRISYNTAPERQRQRDRGMGMLPDQPPLGGLARTRGHQINDIILVSKEEADLVLERLVDIIDKYEVVTVADLHDLVGLPSNYVDNKWGWFNLAEADIRQTRQGWLIDLPPVEAV
jgi:hypothetical protein